MNLFEQFQRLANAYFLILLFLQVWLLRHLQYVLIYFEVSLCSQCLD